MKMSEHFELPLKSDTRRFVSNARDLFVAETAHNVAIAHAVNCHDDLVEALKNVIRPYGPMDVAISTTKGATQDSFLDLEKAIVAALFKAEASS